MTRYGLLRYVERKTVDAKSIAMTHVRVATMSFLISDVHTRKSRLVRLSYCRFDGLRYIVKQL